MVISLHILRDIFFLFMINSIKFEGRELGALIQILPIALWVIEAPKIIVKAWCVLAELGLFFYKPEHAKGHLPNQAERVCFEKKEKERKRKKKRKREKEKNKSIPT